MYLSHYYFHTRYQINDDVDNVLFEYVFITFSILTSKIIVKK